ncbi:MAG: InlB B-repeat-containing protein [Clostridia bacterium]|nr:InlB B-repeat-containing protein [Clostridia bacterium]
MGGGIIGLKHDESSSHKITASAANENANYGTLTDGSSYYYSDETKINAFRAGTSNTDVSKQVVNNSADHGTAANPYVISNVTQWKSFAGDTTNAQNANKVFVLGADIDFGNTESNFLPVPILGAKFYGCNYVLSNITYTFNNAYNCGVFQTAKATAVIADFSVKDSTFKKTGKNVFNYDTTDSGTGFICGMGACSIMNCHASGRIGVSGGEAYICYSGGAAGIVGRLADYTKNIFLYRCSVNFEVVAALASSAGNLAGLCSDIDQGTNLSYGVSVLDCFVIGKYSVTQGVVTVASNNAKDSTGDPWFGGAVHFGRFHNRAAGATTGVTITHKLENIVAYSDMTDKTKARRSEGSLFNGWIHDYAKKSKINLSVANTYSSGKLHSSGSTWSNALNGEFDMKPAVFWTTSQGTDFFSHPSVSNSNWFGNATAFYTVAQAVTNGTVNSSYDTYAKQNIPATQSIKWTSQADMYANVKNDATFPAKIWTNKEAIDNTYMTGFYGTSTYSFSVEESPVRNPLKITVSYYDYKTTGDTQIPVSGSTDSIVVEAGDTLYTPTRTNRIFKGWTTDKTGESTPFKTVPNDMYGDNKLYAVWELDQKSVNISTTGAGLTGNATDGYELIYNGNGDGKGIKLTANLITTGIGDPDTDADITYQWQKGGSDVDGGTEKTLKVENVGESGAYSVSVKYQSKIEPLFTGEVKIEDVTPVTATVKPAPLTYIGITFPDANKRPYSGAPYTTAVPTAEFRNSSNQVITGTTEWEFKIHNFNDSHATVSDGIETKGIVFKPDSTYNGNYGVEIKQDVEFQIEYLKMTFTISALNLTLEAPLEYGQLYTYANVATEFDKVFRPYLEDSEGYSPAFENQNGEAIKLNEYRKQTGTAYPDVTTNYTINVLLVPQEYTASFDARNNGAAIPSQTRGHGKRLEKPADPTYGLQLFLGWYYKDTDDAGKEIEKKWDFNDDRLTKDLELYAKWLNADTLDPELIVELNKSTYFAFETIDPSMLKVTAKFQGHAEGGETIEQEVVLTSDQYVLEYEDGKSQLHVKADGSKATVTIKYTFVKTGQTDQVAQKALEVTVNPIELNTPILREKYFKDTVVVVKTVDGVAQPQEMKPLESSKIVTDIPELRGATIEYKYYDISENEIAKERVKDIDTYYVRAYFTPTSIEYTAPYIQAKFQIVDTRIALTLTWKDDQTEFTYNGKVQHPTPIFKNADDEIVQVDFEYTSGHDKIKANLPGETYTLKLELKDLAYELKGADTLGGNTASVSFTISSATFEIPKQIKNFKYIGQEIDLNSLSETECKLYFKGFDLNFMRVQFGEGIVGDKGTDAGHYTARIELLDPASAQFVGGDTIVSMNWVIDKALISVDWSGHTFYEQQGNLVPTVQQFYGFFGSDGEAVDYSADIDYSGDIIVTKSGDYKITVYIKSSAAWAKNYELDNSKTCSFVVLPREGMEIITIVWDSNTILEYNGKAQRPSFRILNTSNVDITDSVSASEFRFSYNDGLSESKWKGDYTVTVSMRPGSNYYLKGDPTCLYSIELNEAGEGNNPNTVQKPDDNDVKGDNPRTDTSNLPLWQLIVGGASAVLFVFCTLKAFGEYGKLKAAKKEAKELAAQSYITTYGFAPLGLLAMAAGSTFLGLEETPWTIIALVALGLFLVSAVALFMLSKKRKAAELVVKREEARIAEEKEYAREEERREEQARRDNEMKMMFAAMQQNYQPQPYEDVRGLIAETMQAFLPMMQQQMALPPAQSDSNAYSAPQPAYNAPQNNEVNDLRAMMAQQQAQMAQQQELLNQLLQNQTQQSAPAYEEEPVDDVSWLGENEEVVSLEESYGNLSDEGKRAYYEIGSYIMNKPRTSQNDGRYAVLFKYRGKTLFKLAIKDDAPVLYYPLNGGRGELRIADPESLGKAKSYIDMQDQKNDSQMPKTKLKKTRFGGFFVIFV